MSIKVNNKKFRDAIDTLKNIEIKKYVEQLLNSITRDSDNPEIPIEVDENKFNAATFDLDCLESTINCILYILYRASEKEDDEES